MLDVQQEFDIASITAGLLRYHIAMIYYLTRTRQDGSESIAHRYNGSYSPIVLYGTGNQNQESFHKESNNNFQVEIHFKWSNWG